MKNKKSILVCMMLALVPGLFCSGLTLDVKSRMYEKTVFAPIHTASYYFLLRNGYTVFDFGEDYAVWLIDFDKKVRQTKVKVSFTVKVTGPSMWEEGEALAEKRVSFSYDPGKLDSFRVDEPFLAYLEEKLKFVSTTVKLEASIGGMLVYKTIVELIEEIER
jgi:hypothetical protein